jgi:hypothetical protein
MSENIKSELKPRRLNLNFMLRGHTSNQENYIKNTVRRASLISRKSFDCYK